MTVGSESYPQPLQFAEDGAEIAKFVFGVSPPPESEVKVEARGTATIAIEVAGVDGKFGMPECDAEIRGNLTFAQVKVHNFHLRRRLRSSARLLP